MNKKQRRIWASDNFRHSLKAHYSFNESQISQDFLSIKNKIYQFSCYFFNYRTVEEQKKKKKQYNYFDELLLNFFY